MMKFDYFFTMSKSNTGSIIFSNIMQTLKYDKYFISVFLINAYAIIFYRKTPIIFYFINRYFYDRRYIFLSELNGITNQVLKKQSYLNRVTSNNRKFIVFYSGICFN